MWLEKPDDAGKILAWFSFSQGARGRAIFAIIDSLTTKSIKEILQIRSASIIPEIHFLIFLKKQQ